MWGERRTVPSPEALPLLHPKGARELCPQQQSQSWAAQPGRGDPLPFSSPAKPQGWERCEETGTSPAQGTGQQLPARQEAGSAQGDAQASQHYSNGKKVEAGRTRSSELRSNSVCSSSGSRQNATPVSPGVEVVLTNIRRRYAVQPAASSREGCDVPLVTSFPNS